MSMAEIEPDLAVCLVHDPDRGEELFPFLEALLPAAGQAALELIVTGPRPEHPDLARLERAFPEIIILEGKAADNRIKARNHACRLAKARYFSFWDTGLRPRPGAIEALLAFLDENPEAGMAAPRIVNPEGMVLPTARAAPTLSALLCLHTALGRSLPAAPAIIRAHLLTGYDHLLSFEAPWLTRDCLVIRRELREEIGLPDEGFAGEYAEADYCLRAAQAGWHLHYLAGAVMVQSGGRLSAFPDIPATGKGPELAGDCARLLLKKWLRPARLPA